MSLEVGTALVQGYKDYVEVKFQQRKSRLRRAVRVEEQNAKYDFYDRVTATAAQEVTTRHGDTPLISTPHDRRRVGLRHFDWADLIDDKDRLQMLADPTSAYVRNAVSALNRSIDDVLITAALGSAWYGETGASEQTYDTTYRIAVDFDDEGGAGATGLTVAKLREARRLLDTSEATGDEEDSNLFIVVSPKQIQNLLTTTEVTSADYNTVKALVAGNINSFMGFEFIKSNRLTTDASSYRQVLAYEKEGLLLAMAKDLTIDVGPRRDKRNAIQVYVCGAFGAVRMYEEKIIQILCSES